MATSYCLALAQRMRLLRLDDGRTKASMARLLGILPRTYCYYESASFCPGIEFVGRFADYFHVTCDYLLGLSDDPHGYKFPKAIAYYPQTETLSLFSGNSASIDS